MTVRFPAIEPYDSGMLDVGDGHQVYWECCGNPARQARALSARRPWLRLLAGPAAFLRSRRLPGRALRPARVRTQPAAGQRARRRPERQHHRPPDRRHRALRQLHGIEQLDRPGYLLGNAPSAWPTPRHTRSGSRAGAGARDAPTPAARSNGSPTTSAASSRASGTGSPPPCPTRCGTCRWSTPTPRCCSTPILPYASTRRGSGAPGKTRTSHSPPAISPSPRYEDPEFRLRFARLVTHYWRHAAFLEDGPAPPRRSDAERHPRHAHPRPLRRQQPSGDRLAAVQSWSTSQLQVIDDEGHGGGDKFTAAVTGALTHFAAT